jgi:hypothetical protein
LGAQLKAPTAAEQAVRQQYYTDMDAAKQAGAKAAGVSVEEWDRRNAEWGSIKGDKAKEAAFLKKYPTQQAGWDASGKVKDASSAIQQLAPPGPKSEGALRAEKYDANRAQAVTKFSEKSVALAETYNAMPKAQRTAWIKANSQLYTNVVKPINQMLFAGLGTSTPSKTGGTTQTGYYRMYPSGVKETSGRRSGGGGGYGGGGYAPAPVAGGGAPSWHSLNLTTFNASLAALRSQQPGLDKTIGSLFGSSVLTALLHFLSLSDAERRKWLSDPANAGLVASINNFMTWFNSLGAAPVAATPPTAAMGVNASVGV